MKIKTANLIGPALDWAVAKCEGIDLFKTEGWFYMDGTRAVFRPSTNWAQGGLIIERENISLLMAGWEEVESGPPVWEATSYSGRETIDGPTPLIAAMRCYVASKLGDEIEVPDELA